MTELAGHAGRKSTGWRHYVTASAVLLFLFHAYVLWGFAHMAGSHLSPWATWLFVLGPISALAAASTAAWPPLQRPMLTVNVALLGIYLVFWLPQLRHLTWHGW